MSEVLERIIDRLEIDRPGHQSVLERILEKKEAAAKKAATDTLTARQWRERRRMKFTDLSFVGKEYRSRNRRSADKMTAWAVKSVSTSKEAAAQGVSMGMEFAQWNVDSKLSGSGIGLAQVIEGIAERLAKVGPEDYFQERTRLIGFCSVLETYAQLFAGYACQSDLERATQQAASLANLENWQAVQIGNAYSRKPDIFGGLL